MRARPAGTMTRVAEGVALLVVLFAVAYCGWFRLSGGHWERVETASMGTTAPVGTLVWVEPVDAADLRVGDIVTFRAPGRPGEVFTHRVTTIRADHTFTTAGDLSGSDPWRVAPGDVVGRARWLWPGAGWLVRAIPILLVGAVLTWGVMLLRRRDRLPIALVGGALTSCAALIVFHPLTAAEQLSVDRTASGVQASYVGTGLLPVRLSAPGNRSVELAPGESGTVVASHPANGRLEVHLEPAVPDYLWALLIGVCFAPAVASLRGGRRLA